MLKSTESGVIGEVGQSRAVAAFSEANRAEAAFSVAIRADAAVSCASRRNSALGKLLRNLGVEGEWHKPE